METAFAQLLARVAAGDAAAQDELITGLYPRVRQIVHRELQHDFRKNHAWIMPLFSTQDVVQGVFEKVVRNLSSCEFADEAALVRYLGTVVRNRLLDAVRFHEAGRRDARRSAQAPTGGVPALGIESGEGSPELAADLSERAEALSAVLAELPERHRSLIQLRIVDEEAFPEVARQLGYASAETARQAFHEAKARLLVKLRSRGVR